MNHCGGKAKGATHWSRLPSRTVMGMLWLYKRTLSPMLPPSCRFYPSCSEYAAEAFRSQPFGRALWLSLRRLVKCGPWHPGGHDPTPPGESGPAD